VNTLATLYIVDTVVDLAERLPHSCSRTEARMSRAEQSMLASTTGIGWTSRMGLDQQGCFEQQSGLESRGVLNSIQAGL